MVAKDVTTASIWFHTRSSKANLAGLAVLKSKTDEIRAKLTGKSLIWREQETSSLDVAVEGIGWGTENPGARRDLLNVLAVLATIAKKYTPELRAAIDSAD